MQSTWKFVYQTNVCSQHHRLVEVCRDLSISRPTSMLKQCQLEQFALDHVQLGFDCLH